MAKANTTWKVLPHGPIEKLSERLWRVEGSLEGAPIKRVMTIVKRGNGTLLVHNAIALEESAMAEIEGWGKVTAIVVPNGFHRLDAKVFHDRYPDAEVIGPIGSRGRIEQVVPLTHTYDELPPDEAVKIEYVDGTKQREGVITVRAADGTSVIINDCVFNMPHRSGFQGFILRQLTDSTGGPRVSRISRLFLISDKAAFRAHLERLAALPNLRHVVVSHHETIDRDPGQVLRGVAERV